METKDLCIPSLTDVFDEYNFSPRVESLGKIKKIERLLQGIFYDFYQKKMILSINKCKLIKSDNDELMFLLKIFFDINKYFKLFFIFSKENKFLGISFNDHRVIVLPNVSRKYLKNLVRIELRNIEVGICAEKSFISKFMPLYTSNNRSCLGFEDVTGKPKFDRNGVDIVIRFKLGAISIQLKVARENSTIYDQKKVAERQFNKYPNTGIFFVSEDENYSETKKRLSGLIRKIWSGEYPFVSYYIQ